MPGKAKRDAVRTAASGGSRELGELRPPGAASAAALGAVAFVCGVCVMVLEMAGARVIAPYAGTSQVVWTSLIGVILVSMTIGNWAGGRAADRFPMPELLSLIIAIASVASMCIGIWGAPLMRWLASGGAHIYTASLLGSLCLFAVPSAALGMVSPFVMRLAMISVMSSGSTAGRISALSNAGSIAGTFLGGFVLVSVFSSRTILFLVGTVLAFASMTLTFSARRSRVFTIIIAIAFTAAACGQIYREAGDPVMTEDGIEINTKYSTIRITDTTVAFTKRPVRMLQTDPISAQSLMYLDAPSELYSDYTKFYDLAFHYKPDTKRVLMLGGGGYCVPRYLSAVRPETEVDVVELDPGVTQAARDWFHLEDRPGQRIFHEDARAYVNREAASGEIKYDAVFEDVFSASYNIPFHMTTAECMRSIRGVMADDGVFVINIIADIQSELFAGIYSSIAANFPTVMIYPATYPNSAAVRQNVLIVALCSEDVPEREPATPLMAALLQHRWTAPYTPKIAAFTDQFAPVERYALRR